MRAQQAKRLGGYYLNAADNGGLFTQGDQGRMATGDMFMEAALVAPHASPEAEAQYWVEQRAGYEKTAPSEPPLGGGGE